MKQDRRLKSDLPRFTYYGIRNANIKWFTLAATITVVITEMTRSLPIITRTETDNFFPLSINEVNDIFVGVFGHPLT